MEVAVEGPPPVVVKEEKRADAKPEIAPIIGSALPIVFESFQSPQRAPSIKPEDSNNRLEAAKVEMGEVREENERLKTLLSRIVGEYQTLHTHFLDLVKVREQQAAAKNNKAELLLAEPAPAPPASVADDDLVSLSLGTRSNNGGGALRKGHHERSSSSSGTGGDSQLSLGLGFGRPSSADGDDKAASAGPVLNLSSRSSSSADDQDTTAPMASGEADAGRPGGETRKSPSGDGADEEVQQQAKKTRVSVRVKCDTPTMNDGCQWRKYGQKISKGNPCPRAYYRCTVAPNCPVRKQVQRCADDKAILITTYEGAHNHALPPAATAMASTTSAAAAMLTAGSTTSTSASFAAARHHLPPGLLGPTTMVSTAASCPSITLDLTAPAHASSPYAGYESGKALPTAWSGGYPAYGPASYYAKSSPATMGHLFGGVGLSASRPADQLFGHHQSSSSFLQRTSSLGGQPGFVTDTLAKAITSDPSFQSALAAMITSYMGRGGEAAQK